MGIFHVTIRDTSHAFHHIELAFFSLHPGLPFLKSIMGKLHIHLAFVIVIYGESRIGVPHLIPHISIRGHSEEVTGSACAKVALEREVGNREIPGELRRHLIPVLHSTVHTACYNNVRELEVIKKFVLLTGSIINFHSHLGYSERSYFVASAAIIQRALNLDAALEDMFKLPFLVPALELRIM